jgi:hypothetical protein
MVVPDRNSLEGDAEEASSYLAADRADAPSWKSGVALRRRFDLEVQPMSSRHHHAVLGSAAIMTALLLGSAAFGQTEHHMRHHMPAATGHQPAHTPEDPRTLVELPDELRVHMLTNMRDHLLALQQIQEALADDEFEEAAQIAEQRLGMTSMERHGAHAVGPFMPQAMRMTGTAMHRAASQFAVTASDASATGDVKPALADLARVTAQCVACHEGFRVQ